MPFDALDTTAKLPEVQPQDELAALGITPVPMADLICYKRDVLKKVQRRRHAPAWKTYHLPSVEYLGRLGLCAPFELTWWRSAPKQVRRLAQRVQNAIPTASFHVGYIYKDPYLMVEYGTTEACLGIWTNRTRFGLVAIAKG